MNPGGSTWVWRLPTFDTRPQELASPSPPTRLTVYVAGRLYDRARIAGALGLSVDASPEQIVEGAYSVWGTECCRHLRGPFAVAIVDPGRRLRFVARDHSGLQPVFYAHTTDALYVSNASHALARLPDVSPAFNRVALADLLCRRSPYGDETFFDAVRRLPAGSRLAISSTGAPSVSRYWNPVHDAQELHCSEDEAYERFLHTQSLAVQRAIDNEPTSLFLSGGIDSSSVAIAARDEAGGEAARLPLALSMTFPGQECDETARQLAIARQLGLPQQMVAFDDAVGHVSLFVQGQLANRVLSSPLENFWRPAYMNLAHVGAAQGMRAVLTGDGGDEWMLSSPFTPADLLMRGRWRDTLHFDRMWRHVEGGSLLWRFGLRPQLGRAMAAIGGARREARRARRYMANDPSWVAPDDTLRAEQRRRAGAALGAAAPPQGFAVDARDASLTAAHCQRDHEERATLAAVAGLRFALPYFDPDFVELCCALPLSALTAGGRLRGLARRQLHTRLPALAFIDQKKLMATAVHHRMLRRHFEQQRARCSTPRLEALGVVNQVAMRAAFSDVSDDSARRWFELEMMESWVTAHG